MNDAPLSFFQMVLMENCRFAVSLLFFPEFPKNLAHYSFDHYTYYSHKILCMQVILELDDCSIRVYRSFAEHIQYSSSFSHTHLIHALNHCYQVGQYLKHAQKPPNILKLCLRVSYYSGIILSRMFTYYSQNYAGIIGAGLVRGW